LCGGRDGNQQSQTKTQVRCTHQFSSKLLSRDEPRAQYISILP
jgi:hypothetical protein